MTTEPSSQPITRRESKDQNSKLLGRLSIENAIVIGSVIVTMTTGWVSIANKVETLSNHIADVQANRKADMEAMREYVDTRSPYALAESALTQWQRTATANDERHDAAIDQLRTMAQDGRVWQARVESKIDRALNGGGKSE